MKCVAFIQFYFITNFVRADIQYENRDDNDLEIEKLSKCMAFEDSGSEFDNNEVNSTNTEENDTLPKYPVEPGGRRNGYPPKPTTTSHTEIIRDDNSIEMKRNKTGSSATEYMELFTNTISPTFEVKNMRYQGNMSYEESNEAKSTLIDYPFSVSIQRKGVHYTTGALLNKLWVITVAGEFYNVRDSLKLFRARLGSVDCKRGGIMRPFQQIEFHPYYIHGKPNFDVALLRLAFKVEFSNVIRPIAISNVKGKILSAKFMTTYWPRIMVKGSVLPMTASERIKFKSMRVSTQRLIPEPTCMSMLKSLDEPLNESTFCLKSIQSHHSVCMPDPGAPIVAEDGLWGITSGWTSPKCPKQISPTVFTRLSSPSVSSWLNTILPNLI